VFENDYIMRMILQLVRVLRRSLARQFPTRRAELEEIEGAVAEAVDLDPRLMFALEPQSLVEVLELGNFDPQLAAWVVRSLYYESDLLENDGQLTKADLRRRQADAIATRFDLRITVAEQGGETLAEFLDQQAGEAKD
jgi:hypothetical protein